MIQVQVVGVAGVKRGRERLTSMARALELAPRGVVYRAALALRRALKEAAPYREHAPGDDRPHLRDSIGFRTISTPAGTVARFHAARHAIFVIGGTRAHEIWAGIFTGGGKQRRALFWPGAAHPVTHVRHPGTKPNDFRKKAWAEAGPEVRSILRQTGRAILRGEQLGADVKL